MADFLFEIENMLFTRRARDDGHDEYTLRIDSLRVGYGEKLALLGPSGCGKSTCLDILAMILRPDSADRFITRLPCTHGTGEMKMNSETDLCQLWTQQAHDLMARLRMHGLAYVLQSGGLLPFLNNRQNILLPCRALQWDMKETASALQELAGQLGIAHLLDKMPAQLSVGERQRVAIARALLPRPVIILADEPTAALDPLTARTVMNIFATLAEKAGTSLVLVSHAAELVRDSGFQCLTMNVTDKSGHIEARVAMENA